MISLLRPEYQGILADDEVKKNQSPGVLAYDNSATNGILQNQLPGEVNDQNINRNAAYFERPFDSNNFMYSQDARNLGQQNVINNLNDQNNPIDPNSFSNENINAIITGDTGVLPNEIYNTYPQQEGLGVLQRDQLQAHDNMGNVVQPANTSTLASPERGTQVTSGNNGAAKEKEDAPYWNKTRIGDMLMTIGSTIQDGLAARAGYRSNNLEQHIQRKSDERNLQQKLAHDKEMADKRNRQQLLMAMQAAQQKQSEGQYGRIADLEKRAKSDQMLKDLDSAYAQQNKIYSLLGSDKLTGLELDSALETYIKSLDPRAIVREADIQRASNAQGLLAGYRTQLKKLGGGTIDRNNPIVQNILKATNTIRAAMDANAANFENQYRDYARNQGLNYGENVFQGGIFTSNRGMPQFQQQARGNQGGGSEISPQQRSEIIAQNAKSALETY